MHARVPAYVRRDPIGSTRSIDSAVLRRFDIYSDTRIYHVETESVSD
jgi:hypothetical protein